MLYGCEAVAPPASQQPHAAANGGGAQDGADARGGGRPAELQAGVELGRAGSASITTERL